MSAQLEAAKSWIEFARSDLDTAALLLDSASPHYWVICFHSQQTAEKCLKAVLTIRNIAFPRTHDLGALLSLLQPDDLACFDLGAVPMLTVWAVEGRYPGDLSDATLMDAESAYRTAEAVLRVAESMVA